TVSACTSVPVLFPMSCSVRRKSDSPLSLGSASCALWSAAWYWASCAFCWRRLSMRACSAAFCCRAAPTWRSTSEVWERCGLIRKNQPTSTRRKPPRPPAIHQRRSPVDLGMSIASRRGGGSRRRGRHVIAAAERVGGDDRRDRERERALRRVVLLDERADQAGDGGQLVGERVELVLVVDRPDHGQHPDRRLAGGVQRQQ